MKTESTKLRQLLEQANIAPSRLDPQPAHDFDYEDIIHYMKNEQDLDKLYKWAKLFVEYYEWHDND